MASRQAGAMSQQDRLAEKGKGRKAGLLFEKEGKTGWQRQVLCSAFSVAPEYEGKLRIFRTPGLQWLDSQMRWPSTTYRGAHQPGSWQGSWTRGSASFT